MFNTYADAASKINGEIENLVRKLDRRSQVDDKYLEISRAIRILTESAKNLSEAAAAQE